MVEFWPPLGTVEGVRAGKTLTLTAVSVPDDAQPQVWTNVGGQWEAHEFVRLKANAWKVDVPCPQTGEFEFTYRLVRGNDVEWLGSAHSNGRIRVRSSIKEDDERVHRFIVDCDVGREQYFDLDVEQDDFDKGMVWERSAWVWNTPRLLQPPVLDSLSDKFESTFLLLKAAERFTVFYALSTDTVTASLIKHKGKLSVRARRDVDGQPAALVIHVSAGTLDAATSKAYKLAQRTLADQLGLPIPQLKAHTRRGLTFCTWNALGPSYTLSQVLDALDKLKDESNGAFGEAIDTVVLDDGWQDVAHFDDPHFPSHQRRGLKSFGVAKGWFDVDGAKVESGRELERAVQLIKAKGIKRVGVWVTLQGYWDGFHPAFKDAHASPDLVECNLRSSVYEQFGNMTWYLPRPDQIADTVESYYRRIAEQGVELIKIDDQAHQDFLTDSSVHRLLLDAAHDSAARHFDHVVHCMPGSPRIYGGKLSLLSSAANVIRNSDDFFPDVEGSHAPHLWLNAHSAVFTRELVQKPDFDMCQGDHPWGPAHVALRAFQVAPIWTTDRPESKAASQSWEPLLASDKSSGVRVLQASSTGAVLPSRLWRGMDEPLVVVSKSGNGLTVCIIGLAGRRHVVLLRTEFEHLLQDHEGYVVADGGRTSRLGEVVWSGEVEARQVFTLHIASIETTADGSAYAQLGLSHKIMALESFSEPRPAKPMSKNGSSASVKAVLEEVNDDPVDTKPAKPATPSVSTGSGRRLASILSALPRRTFSSSLFRSQTGAFLHELKERPVATLMSEMRNLVLLSLAFVWIGWIRVVRTLRFRHDRRLTSERKLASSVTSPVASPVLESSDGNDRRGQFPRMNGNGHAHHEDEAVGADIAFAALYAGCYRIWTDSKGKIDSVLVDGKLLDDDKVRLTSEDEEGRLYEITIDASSNDYVQIDDSSAQDDVWSVEIRLGHD